MAEILLFHHAQGLTAGVQAFAAELRAAGHIVHTPDLYDGKTFANLDDGMANAKSIGFDTIVERSTDLASDLSEDLVYAGFSLGGMSAQSLTQTRPGAKGLLLLHTAIPISEFGVWPAGVPLQIHTMEDDDYGDADVALEISETLEEAEVFTYPGESHLFTDNSLSDYDEAAAALVMQRTKAFLAAIR